MTTGVVAPDEKTFLELARAHRVIPVTRRLLADGETPVGVYRKLAGGPGTFLLESAEHGAASGGTAWSRYSFIGVRSMATLTERDGKAVWLGTPPAGVPTSGDPISVLREAVRLLSGDGQPATGVALPPLTGGLVGYLSYDVVRRFEKLPELANDDLKVPELGMVLATDLVVLDHFEGSAMLVANAILPPKASRAAAAAAYHQAIGRLDAMTTALSRPTPPMVSTVDNPGVGRFVSRTPRGCTRRRWRPPRRTSRPVSASRSWWRSASSGRPTPTRWTSTGCCGRPTPARTCICCGLTGSTSWARPRRPT